MIRLTRLNGDPILVNAMLIETVDPGVDTRLNLSGGSVLVIREPATEVAEAVTAWFSTVFGAAMIRNHQLVGREVDHG